MDHQKHGLHLQSLLKPFPLPKTSKQRKAAGVTNCCVRQLPAPVLSRVVTVEEDLHAVGLGFNAPWGPLSTERAKLPVASFDLQRERTVDSLRGIFDP